MRKVAKRKASTVRQANQARAEFVFRVGYCMNCGERRVAELVAHEIARGVNRFKGIQEPLAQLVLCNDCHRKLHHEGWTVARQIAIRERCLPNEPCRLRVNELRGRAPESITQNEVDEAMPS